MRNALVAIAASLLAAGCAAPDAKRGAGDDLRVLDRTVRLDFTLVPDKDAPETFVLTAVSAFRSHMTLKGRDEEDQISLAGHVALRPGGRILVVVEAETAFLAGGTFEKHEAAASALLTPGTPCEIASVGDQRLVVRATLPDTEKTKP
jgi:hypothetical protein